jgi:N-acetyl-gamma-glutamyl-phosphate reductase
MNRTVALVGGRGYTGAELLSLLATHPQMDLAFASSSSQAGQAVRDICPAWPDPDTSFVALQAKQVQTRQADAWVLAVPNGVAADWASRIREAHPDSAILDLSADHRFEKSWTYGLPERFRERIRESKLISNPGCYATGAQLGLLPVLDYLVGTAVVFGVSGYSGAGRTPSDKNNPDRLHDNILPYSLAGHVHEQEISHQLGRAVRFMPHVASFFRGISLTISAQVDHEATPEKLLSVYTGAYRNEPRIRVLPGIPEVQAVRETPDVHVGGFAVDERDPTRFTVVVTLDNLSKGAATQAMQNLNLALGLEENMGIERGDRT